MNLTDEELMTERFFEFCELERFRYADNYIGPDYREYFYFYGKHRDSDPLSISNFGIIVKTLKEAGILIDEYERPEKAKHHVLLTRFGDWAVGWIEHIMIKEDAPLEVRRIIFDLYASMESYPVLDDEDYTLKEEEEYGQYYTMVYFYENENIKKPYGEYLVRNSYYHGDNDIESRDVNDGINLFGVDLTIDVLDYICHYCANDYIGDDVWYGEHSEGILEIWVSIHDLMIYLNNLIIG